MALSAMSLNHGCKDEKDHGKSSTPTVICLTPCTFVNANVETGEGEPGLVVDRNAVQILDNESVVFIQHEPEGSMLFR